MQEIFQAGVQEREPVQIGWSLKNVAEGKDTWGVRALVDAEGAMLDKDPAGKPLFPLDEFTHTQMLDLLILHSLKKAQVGIVYNK